jgi:hypothetical protein
MVKILTGVMISAKKVEKSQKPVKDSQEKGCQGRTARTGQQETRPGEDWQDRTDWTGQPGQNS